MLLLIFFSVALLKTHNCIISNQSLKSPMWVSVELRQFLFQHSFRKLLVRVLVHQLGQWKSLDWRIQVSQETEELEAVQLLSSGQPWMAAFKRQPKTASIMTAGLWCPSRHSKKQKQNAYSLCLYKVLPQELHKTPIQFSLRPWAWWWRVWSRELTSTKLLLYKAVNMFISFFLSLFI